jgi:hypothetical protein
MLSASTLSGTCTGTGISRKAASRQRDRPGSWQIEHVSGSPLAKRNALRDRSIECDVVRCENTRQVTVRTVGCHYCITLGGNRFDWVLYSEIVLRRCFS